MDTYRLPDDPHALPQQAWATETSAPAVTCVLPAVPVLLAPEATDPLPPLYRGGWPVGEIPAGSAGTVAGRDGASAFQPEDSIAAEAWHRARKEGGIVAQGRTRRRRRPELTIAQILDLVDVFYQRHGRWPRSTDSAEWRSIDDALRKGQRGLPGQSSLAQLLTEQRGVRNIRRLPPLTEAVILAWADEHYERCGCWPTENAGKIAAAPGETWGKVSKALRNGSRGLSGGTTLAQLLARDRGTRNRMALPKLTIKQILAWADAHHRRTGTWPLVGSGPVLDAPDETWKGIEVALQQGHRGLDGGTSLYRLLVKHRGIPERRGRPRSKQRVS